MTLDSTDRDQIGQLLEMGEDELYATIPMYIPEYEDSVFSPQKRVEVGRNTFRAYQDKLTKIICEEWNFCERINKSDWSDTVDLVAAIADVIATAVSGIPPFIIGTLLVKIGIRKFCECTE